MLPDVAGFRPQKRGAKITNKQATLPYSVSPRMSCGQMARLEATGLDGALALRAYNEDLYPRSFFSMELSTSLACRPKRCGETL
jgi:hypothetical protein